MKKWLAACLLLCITSVCSAQELTLRDAFRQMPDSLMPSLTQNDRLDFLDFLDAGMRAEVKNRLGGTSVMTALTADSLSLQVSPATHRHCKSGDCSRGDLHGRFHPW